MLPRNVETASAVPSGWWRRKSAPLLLLAAGLGAYTALDSRAPRTRQVTILLGEYARSTSELELSWSNPHDPTSEAALTTRWTFAPGSAPRRLHTEIKLPNGPWDAELSATRIDGQPAVRRTIRVTLEGGSWLRHDDAGQRVALPLDEAAHD